VTFGPGAFPAPLFRTTPLPRWHDSVVVVRPPSREPGAWAGAPSAILVGDEIFLAYRLRRPADGGRGYANVVARTTDGMNLTPVAEVGKERFGGASLERPALVLTPTGRWRLYVSVATPNSKHWRVVLLEADSPAGLGSAQARTVLPGDASMGVKDPVIMHDGELWHLWASCHPLESDEHADRMSTWYATSPDGVDWSWVGVALAGRPGHWDARGTRVTSVWASADGLGVQASYDGRATAGENWEERTGLARGKRTDNGLFEPLVAGDDPPLGSPHPPGGLRYLSVVTLADGEYRIYYEATGADGAHELRSELIRA
jgi:hypothetical protein